jgi:hypothetical protein
MSICAKGINTVYWTEYALHCTVGYCGYAVCKVSYCDMPWDHVIHVDSVDWMCGDRCRAWIRVFISAIFCHTYTKIYKFRHQILGANRSIKHGLAHPRNISSVRIRRGPREMKLTIKLQVGERLWFEEGQPEPAKENRVLKKKLWEAVQPLLETSGDRTVTFEGVTMMSSAGPVRSPTLIAARVS